jgi:thioredoxin-related protein
VREAGCKPKYLKVLAFALALPLLGSAETGADPVDNIGIMPRVEQSRDIRADAQLAQTHKLPILLAFTTDYCDYCEQLEEDFLQPMLISGHYQDKILIRKVVVDASYRFTDFDGSATYTDQFANHYKVRLYPTVLFLDSQGNELAERMVGITTPEMYGGYLDQNIDEALSKVRK